MTWDMVESPGGDKTKEGDAIATIFRYSKAWWTQGLNKTMSEVSDD